MKKQILISLLIISVLSSCTKKETTRTSGTDTIDNTTYFTSTYYLLGFSFSGANLVSTNKNPGPDITLFVSADTGAPRLTLQANNLRPSFFRVGNFADAPSAQSAFNSLKSVVVSQWVDIADPLTDNQVWIYRSGTDTYTKFRIISTINETRSGIPYGECTFQWFYQSDGSTTFSGK
jgi:hypothetical protein